MHIRRSTEIDSFLSLLSGRTPSKPCWNKVCMRAPPPNGPWCMWPVRSKHNEDALGAFQSRVGGRLLCADCQSPGITRPGIRRPRRGDWRNLPQTAGRLVSSEPGSYTNCTRGGVLFLGGGKGGRERKAEELGSLCERKEKEKRKHPRVTAKHSLP